MPEPFWLIEQLATPHDVDGFDCGEPSLNEYLKKYASQNAKTGVSRAYVATEPGSVKVVGYYTLSAGAVAFGELTDEMKKRLPRYPVSVAHLGRLARDESVRGMGMGEFLLIDAMRKTLATAEEIGIHAIEVIAIDNRARQFYEKYGFQSLLDDQNHLFMSLKTIRKLNL